MAESSPTLVQLEPPGPYRTQAAEGFLGIATEINQLPAQLRFRLANGSELQIPTPKHVLAKLRLDLNKLWAASENPEQ